MNIKKVFIIILFAILVSFRFSVKQIEKKEDIKKWEINSKLRWEDFKGEVDTTSIFGANSSTTIFFKCKENNGFLIVDLSAVFKKNKSWVFAFKKSKELLIHEQIHFDITELSARKIRKKCIELKTSLLSPEKMADTLYKIYDEIYEYEFKDLEYYYDKQTDHSLIIEKQLEWEHKIARELKELNKYSNPIISKRIR
jgi:hypothetical protein